MRNLEIQKAYSTKKPQIMTQIGSERKHYRFQSLLVMEHCLMKGNGWCTLQQTEHRDISSPCVDIQLIEAS